MTAVEWLLEQVENNISTTIIKQAKEMEKQQIIDAFDIACEDENRIGQEHYNETFKNK